MNTGVEDTRHTSALQRQHERAMEGIEALVDKSNSALRELRRSSATTRRPSTT
jgi:hypothetical protein